MSKMGSFRKNANNRIYGAILARVSSSKQFLHGNSLPDQLKQVNLAAEKKGTTIIKNFDYVETGDPEIDGRKFKTIIDYCIDPKNRIKYLFFLSIDRLTRGGTRFYLNLKARLIEHGVGLVDAYGIIQQPINTLEHLDVQFPWSLTNPNETSEMLEAKRGKDEKTIILTRLIGAEIKYRRKGYAVGPTVLGLVNNTIVTPTDGIRKIRAPHSAESLWIIEMFKLRAEGMLDDKQIVKQVNAMGFLTRERTRWDKTGNKPKPAGKIPGKPLTVKQLQRYIQKTEYAGVICDKRTKNQPVKCVGFDGLVNFDVFNKANRGKIAIIEGEDGLKIVHNHKPVRRLKDNPLYPFKNEVLCHFCNKELFGSGPRSKSGKHSPRYHCGRGHKFWSVKRETFHDQMYDFIRSIKFDKDLVEIFQEMVVEVWKEKRKDAEQDSIKYGKQVIKLREERQIITNRLLSVSSQEAIGALEEKLKEVEANIAVTTEFRDKREDKELDMTTLINHAVYFMEHLEDLLIDEANPLRQAALFGLMFDKKPSYKEILNGTPRLSPVFSLNTQSALSKSKIVTQRSWKPNQVILTLTDLFDKFANEVLGSAYSYSPLVIKSGY
jgi:hypothetical protein